MVGPTENRSNSLLDEAEVIPKKIFKEAKYYRSNSKQEQVIRIIESIKPK
jgi:hypothetical protein